PAPELRADRAQALSYLCSSVADTTINTPSAAPRLCPPHPLQHVLDRAFGKRELLCIAGAQHHIRVGPVLRIEERIAADRDLGIGLSDLAELHAYIALARIRAHGFREHANADLELRRHLIKHRLHDRGHARHHDYVADPEAPLSRSIVRFIGRLTTKSVLAPLFQRRRSQSICSSRKLSPK